MDVIMMVAQVVSQVVVAFATTSIAVCFVIFLVKSKAGN